MPANANPLRVLNLQAAADIGQFAAVSSTGTLATAGSAPIGFTTASGKSGTLVPVAVMGSAVAWAGAAIALGQRLEIGANGTVVPLAAGIQVGTALNAAASGDQVEVMMGVPASVSGAGNSLWADRAVVLAAGLRTAFFTDIGVGGSYWDYLGGKWRPQARRVLLKNLITAVSNSAAPKVVLDYATIPAGLLGDGDFLEINVLKTREGGTSDTDATDLMIGSAPTTLGTTTGFSSSALATTTVQFSMEHRLRRESATSVRTLRTAGGGGGLGTLTSLTTLTTGLPNMDSTEVYIQITSDLTTAGGEVAWLRGFTVELITGS